MNAITINCAGDEAAWLAARKSDVTSKQMRGRRVVPVDKTGAMVRAAAKEGAQHDRS